MRSIAATVAVVLALAVLPAAAAQGVLPYDPPLLGAETPRGSGVAVEVDPIPPAVERVVDGDPSDWVGEPTLYGGTAVYSAGEFVYSDHIFDAHGADDGTETERRERLGPVEEVVPETYRLEAATKANISGQAGVPAPPPIGSQGQYGALPYQAHADLVELRVALEDEHVWILARIAQMGGDHPTTALELFGGTADVLLAGDRGWADGVELPEGSVATDASGFTNAIEARLPRALFDTGAGTLRLGAVTGTFDPDGPALVDPANVAFRFDEPVREWFDQEQALALHAGDLSEFVVDIDVDALDSGLTQEWVPGPGYHDRLFLSTTPGLSQPSGREGVWQHYGVYLPSAIETAETLPLQWWLHWRGGTAHVAGMVTPGIFRHMGEDRGGIVVSPRGRGTSTWYVGRGHADFLEVWDDVFATFGDVIDADRVYSSGHSMGGWGSYLLPILYPDRFAATFPVAGPVTQGAWAGCDWDQCYIEANSSRAQDQHTRRMLENLRNVPIAMFYAAADELVPFSGAVRQHERLLELGYRHRFYNFPAHEHFTHPIVDEWAEGVRYLDQFTREENPARVTYVRDLAFEAATNEVQSGGIPFSWAFDSAYWMSELSVAEGADRALFDGTSLAIEARPHQTLPDAAGPTGLNQTGPFVATGLQWLELLPSTDPGLPNGFELTLTGADRVQLDLLRMGVDPAAPVTATITTDTALTLLLDTGDGVVTVEVPQGTHTLELSL